MENVPGEAEPTSNSCLRVRRIEVVDERGNCSIRLSDGEIQIIGSVELLDAEGKVFGELGSISERAWLNFGRGDNAQLRMATHRDEAHLILSSGPGPGPLAPHEDDTAQAMVHVRSAWTERGEASPALAGLVLDFAGGTVEGRRLLAERQPDQ